MVSRSDTENMVHGGRFDQRRESLDIVKVGSLVKAFSDDPSFLFLERTIKDVLGAENPFATNYIL